MEEQKLALEKMLYYVNAMIAGSAKAVNETDARDSSLLGAAQDYCRLIENRRTLEEELAKVSKAAIPHETRRN